VLAVSNAVIDRKQRETERALGAETAAREDLQRAVDRERRGYYGYAFELARRDWLAGDIEQARRRLLNVPAELPTRAWETRTPAAVLLGQPVTRQGGFQVTVWDLVNGRRAAGSSRKSGGYVVLSPDGARAMLAARKPAALAFDSPESVSVCDTRTGRELCALAV